MRITVLHYAIHADSSADERASKQGGACFDETFSVGREFNLSLLNSPEGPRVLPPAEILFEGYASRQACIVGDQAKWDEHSYAYRHTLRRFDFDPMDNALLKQLEMLSLECWERIGYR
jgi:D-alanine-D-alanine ligase